MCYLAIKNQVTLFADERVIYESQGGASHALPLDLDTIYIKLKTLNITWKNFWDNILKV